MVSIENLTAAQRKELVMSEEDLRELERARKMAIVFDEDSPETTPERAVKFRRVNPPRKNRKLAY